MLCDYNIILIYIDTYVIIIINYKLSIKYNICIYIFDII